jgi:probable HAF family extracellular repeat protein
MRTSIKRLLVVGVTLVLVTIAPLRPGAGQSPLYGIVDLNITTEARVNFARGTNMFNHVVGRSGAVNGASTRAMFWGAGGTVMSLGVLDGGDYSAAFGLNDIGEIVGSSNTSTVVRAVVWAAGRMEVLDLLPDDVASEAFAINNSSDVVGYSSGPNGVSAVLWKGRRDIQRLGTLPGGDYSVAYAINIRGDVVGESTSAQGKRAFLWTEQGGMIDLGTLPGDTTSGAAAINNRGQVVGYSMGPNGSRAVLWSQGKIQNLGTLPGGTFSRALAINTPGLVVGTSDSSSGTRAFLWTAVTGMVDVNTLLPLTFHHVLSEAQSLNDNGFMVASSGGGPHHDIEAKSHVNHDYRVFLLTP